MMVSCVTHGDNLAAFVCDHIRMTIKDSIPRGFAWERQEGNLNASCSACDLLIQENGNDWSDEIIAVSGLSCVCEGCLKVAAAINGVENFQ